MSHRNLKECLNILNHIQEYCTLFEPPMATNALTLKENFEELMRKHTVFSS